MKFKVVPLVHIHVFHNIVTGSCMLCEMLSICVFVSLLWPNNFLGLVFWNGGFYSWTEITEEIFLYLCVSHGYFSHVLSTGVCTKLLQQWPSSYLLAWLLIFSRTKNIESRVDDFPKRTVFTFRLFHRPNFIWWPKMLASKQEEWSSVLLYVLCEEGSAEFWKCQEFGRLHSWARTAALVWLFNRVKQV